MTTTAILAAYNAKRGQTPSRRDSATATPLHGPSTPLPPKTIDPELLLGIVDPETFNCENVYNTFLALTPGWSNLERETKWFEIIHRIVPSKKYQYLFTAEEWRKIYVDFTGRTHLLSTPEFSL